MFIMGYDINYHEIWHTIIMYIQLSWDMTYTHHGVRHKIIMKYDMQLSWDMTYNYHEICMLLLFDMTNNYHGVWHTIIMGYDIPNYHVHMTYSYHVYTIIMGYDIHSTWVDIQLSWDMTQLSLDIHVYFTYYMGDICETTHINNWQY
jgi:hypothetical protein